VIIDFMMRYARRFIAALFDRSIGSDLVKKDYETELSKIKKEIEEWKADYREFTRERLAGVETKVNATADERDAYVAFGKRTLLLLESNVTFLQGYFTELDKAVKKIEKAADRKIPRQAVV
jgi:hypothetical protein